MTAKKKILKGETPNFASFLYSFIRPLARSSFMFSSFFLVYFFFFYLTGVALQLLHELGLAHGGVGGRSRRGLVDQRAILGHVASVQRAQNPVGPRIVSVQFRLLPATAQKEKWALFSPYRSAAARPLWSPVAIARMAASAWSTADRKASASSPFIDRSVGKEE